MAESDLVVIGGVPFAAPAGDAFDVDLIRDVLNRAEESVVSTGPSPALLLVTSGTVFVESSSGLVEMTTGDAAQVSGDVVITGASRAPAAFVVARIGPEVPAPAAAKTRHQTATPAPIATPVTAVEGASVTISASLCPIGYAGGNDVRGLRRSRQRSRIQPDVRRVRQPLPPKQTETATSRSPGSNRATTP